MANRDVRAELERWIANVSDEELAAELAEMKKAADAGDDSAAVDAFFQDLAFGTAGLRGTLGAGTNRMNIYTVGRATQGFADYLNANFENPSVAIARDSRNKGELFVQVTASILAANGIVAHVYPKISPVPTLSFAVRDLGCSGGICMTASHNPAAYNGYKAYGPDGCQITSEAAKSISASIANTDAFSGVKTMGFDEAVASGMVKWIDDAVLERMIGFWLALPSTADAADAQTFIDRYVTFSEVNAEADLRQTATAVFLGKTLLLAEGYGECILIDAKSYPSRGVEEPSSGKVLRGAHDGFIETLVQNAALLRRRIRTPQLTLEGHKISEKSRADVVLCYLEDKVDRALLARVRAKLAAIDADSISMSQESIAESMMDQRQWFNPFPRVRYTERPDAATASIMEGSIIVLVDNSPAAMILPTRFFDFVQEANDFYFPPLVGSYLRILRVVVFLLTLFITPVWYLLVQDPDLPNSALSFLAVTSECEVPILAQLLLTEFIVDLLKLASLNTPSVFSNSFSMIGALVLGDFAVQAHWLVPEVLAYMAFVAIANFAQPSYELGYAFKLLRLVLLVSSAALGWVGLALGTLLIIVLLVTTRPIAGGHYMYPIYPFNWHALRALLIRRPIAPDNT